MKFTAPNTFTDSTPFRRARLKEHCDAVARDYEDQAQRRYIHSSFVMDFGQLATSDDAEEGVMYFKPPALFNDYEIESVEFQASKATATSRDFTATVEKNDDMAEPESSSRHCGRSSRTRFGFASCSRSCRR